MAPHLHATGDSDPVSHNDELYYAELPELNTPYTNDELVAHQSCRALKCALEEHHAHNYRLINEAQAWIKFLYHGGPKPRCNIGAFFMMEAAEAKVNNVSTPMRVFCDSLREYGFGFVPRFRVCIYCSRSAATLYKHLEDIYSSPELITLKAVESEIYELLTNQCPDETVKLDWDKHITFLYQQYLANANVYSAKLSTFIQQKELEYKLRTTGHILTLQPTVGDIKTVASSSVKKLSATIRDANDHTGARAPESPARQRQIHKVSDKIAYLNDNRDKLPKPLRSKPPSKWIHFACEQTYSSEPNGYPSLTALYSYCKKHEDLILQGAGL